MAKDINVCTLTGRLIKDIEIKEVGKSHVCNGCIAVNRSVKKGDTYEDAASFINIRAWASSEKQIAYYSEAFKKGVAVTVAGQVISENYEKDGQKRTSVYVLADSIVPHGSSKSDSGSKTPADKLEEEYPSNIPF